MNNMAWETLKVDPEDSDTPVEMCTDPPEPSIVSAIISSSHFPV